MLGAWAARRSAVAVRLTTFRVLLFLIAPPVMRLSGQRASQEAKCFSEGNRLGSRPTSEGNRAVRWCDGKGGACRRCDLWIASFGVGELGSPHNNALQLTSHSGHEALPRTDSGRAPLASSLEAFLMAFLRNRAINWINLNSGIRALAEGIGGAKTTEVV